VTCAENKSLGVAMSVRQQLEVLDRGRLEKVTGRGLHAPVPIQPGT
jgi:hypothetical protein